MELLFNGKVSIVNDNDELELRIKAPKNWFLIILFGFYSGVLFVSLIVNLYELIFNFIPVWIVMVLPVLLLGIFFFRIFLWETFGKEILIFQCGQLLLKRKAALFTSPKIYDLNKVKDFWVEQEKSSPLQLLYFKRKYLSVKNFGLIRFVYDGELVKFGASLNEIEANYIVSFLKEKNILKNNSWNYKV